ncbi:hypothetical protein LguiB_018231 [Lonicera macranthoides]
MSILSFRQCRTSIANTPKSIHNIRKDAQQIRVDVARSENEVQANTDIEFQRNNEISTFVRLGHQLNSTIFSLFLLVLVSSTKQKVFREVALTNSESSRLYVLYTSKKKESHILVLGLVTQLTPKNQSIDFVNQYLTGEPLLSTESFILYAFTAHTLGDVSLKRQTKPRANPPPRWIPNVHGSIGVSSVAIRDEVSEVANA